MSEKFNERRLLEDHLVLNGHLVKVDRVLGFSIPGLPEDRFKKIYNILFNDEQEFKNDAEKFMFKRSKLLWLKWCNLKRNAKVSLNIGDEVISLRSGFGNRDGGALLKVTEVDKEKGQVILKGYKHHEYIVEYNNWFLSLLKI